MDVNNIDLNNIHLFMAEVKAVQVAQLAEQITLYGFLHVVSEIPCTKEVMDACRPVWHQPRSKPQHTGMSATAPGPQSQALAGVAAELGGIRFSAAEQQPIHGAVQELMDQLAAANILMPDNAHSNVKHAWGAIASDIRLESRNEETDRRFLLYWAPGITDCLSALGYDVLFHPGPNGSDGVMGHNVRPDDCFTFVQPDGSRTHIAVDEGKASAVLTGFHTLCEMGDSCTASMQEWSPRNLGRRIVADLRLATQTLGNMANFGVSLGFVYDRKGFLEARRTAFNALESGGLFTTRHVGDLLPASQGFFQGVTLLLIAHLNQYVGADGWYHPPQHLHDPAEDVFAEHFEPQLDQAEIALIRNQLLAQAMQGHEEARDTLQRAGIPLPPGAW